MLIYKLARSIRTLQQQGMSEQDAARKLGLTGLAAAANRPATAWQPNAKRPRA